MRGVSTTTIDFHVYLTYLIHDRAVLVKNVMTSSGDGRVRFRQPPAIETLQGVFFRSLPDFSSAHQGLLWSRCFREEFPHVEEKNCLEEIPERFGDQMGFLRSGIRVSDRPESPRLWARSDDGSRVLQIQRNAVLANWLRENHQSDYVTYEERREQFATILQTVTRFFAEENLGNCEPTSCLMTYVNQMSIEPLESEPSRAADVFTFIGSETNSGWLPCSDQLAVNVSYPMPQERGRLHVQINPAIKIAKEKRRSVMHFELTARGRPESGTVQSALAWLDLGHEWIVKGFVDITRPSWHLTWERET